MTRKDEAKKFILEIKGLFNTEEYRLFHSFVKNFQKNKDVIELGDSLVELIGKEEERWNAIQSFANFVPIPYRNELTEILNHHQSIHRQQQSLNDNQTIIIDNEKEKDKSSSLSFPHTKPTQDESQTQDVHNSLQSSLGLDPQNNDIEDHTDRTNENFSLKPFFTPPSSNISEEKDSFKYQQKVDSSKKKTSQVQLKTDINKIKIKEKKEEDMIRKYMKKDIIILSSLEQDLSPTLLVANSEEEYSEVEIGDPTPEALETVLEKRKAPIDYSPLPRRKEFKYVEDTVRRKADRELMQGRECEHCKKFYDVVGITDRNKFVHECSKHKSKHTPPSTPPGFWDVGFGTQPD
eukprot:TRINITY_DN1154_c0_g1_i1.p1 TRINITY_DN1154_c0_g1~~TRINITY_DN1154_c0_g1_i1.p1  ORF type:complete len:349 (-),score=94.01 TRINITY_DN1154_c0_g1_i1:1102-2148(-)